MKKAKYWVWFISVVVMAIFFLIGLNQLFSQRHLILFGQRPAGLNQKEIDQFQRLSKYLTGRIIWASNRSGNHELYFFDLGTGKFKQLTHNKMVDYYPKFSPDGRSILFLRSRKPHLSFRQPSGWDAYLFDLDKGTEKLVSREVLSPSFGPAGKSVVYQRKDEIFQHDLSSAKIILLTSLKQLPVKKISEPVLSPDGTKLLLGFSRPPGGIGILDLVRGNFKTIYQGTGCENIWGRHPAEVIWIGWGWGRGKTSVLFSPIDEPEPQILIDLPGDYSHEYFPRLSNDRRWLIWGASRGGHEHDQADYEIFLWAVDKPWSEAVRLTFDPGNDQWPDLWVGARGVAK